MERGWAAVRAMCLLRYMSRSASLSSSPELIAPFPREQNAHSFLSLLTRDTPRQDLPKFDAPPHVPIPQNGAPVSDLLEHQVDRKSTRLNSSH